MAEPRPSRGEAMAYRLITDLAALRAFVCSRAIALGLDASRADMLTLAVNELATNTLQYTHDGGQVQLWTEEGQLVCDVVDQGPVRAFGRAMPPADAVRGRGLAIVEMVCDQVAAFASTRGTVVRMRLGLV
jgi:serine/threonine-protein kinase RsbW